MYFKITDPNVEKILKAFQLNAPSSASSPSVKHIGPTLIRGGDGYIELYGQDAFGTDTLTAYTRLVANVEDPSDVMIQDISLLFDIITQLKYDVEIDINPEGFSVRNDKFRHETQMIAIEPTPSIETLLKNFDPEKPAFAKKEFIFFAEADGDDLNMLFKLNKMGDRSRTYDITAGNISTTNTSVMMEKKADIDPITVEGLDPLLYISKGLGTIRLYNLVGENYISILCFKNDYCTYLLAYMNEEEE